MIRGLLAGAALLAGATAAVAQPAAGVEAGYVGRALHDAKGGNLGEIVQVLRDGQGRPVQVLVRPKAAPGGGLKSLPLSSLRADGGAWRTPLTRAEFDAMPAVQPVR